MEAPVDVAVAVLVRPDGAVLLARRPRTKVYAGYWEFPGGKIEPGEAASQALAREVREELAAEVEEAYPWMTHVFSYPHATVRLHFYRVLRWRGEVRAKEHEGLAWRSPEAVDVSPLLPANGPVLRALKLPSEYAISQAAALGCEAFLARLQVRLREGLALIQLRELDFSIEKRLRLAQRVIALARPWGAKVLLNSDVELARRVGADGVHLAARQVAALRDRPDLPLVGASCHDQAELRAAERLGADFAVLGPVKATPSHPERAPIGWDGFEQALRAASIPVFALGGIVPGDMRTAWSRGAHGISMVRGAWKTR